ncbi:DNA topoisomerase IB [Rhizomonospora bruguierae]|uniref:DNA topoisomerase IB n=1 Tax=Rhizomonospora bruguierae TaxID=1581705 RepID=UPI001BCFF76E|nr:DNA topoisomerase IB [Micromonospora sp. NBRC 107566]
MRLRRSNPSASGYTRRRRGRGVTFLDLSGNPIREPEELGRLRDLVIPPAWRDVWICPDPRGHIQATGIDAAGRRQYLYHPRWRAKRDAAKFDHVLEVAERLPQLRKRATEDLRLTGMPRDRVLALTARLLDLGLFRVGGDEYANGDEPSYGIATLRPEHARAARGCVVFEYVAKGGIERVQTVRDPQVCEVLNALRRRRRGAERLFAYRDGRQWRDVHSDDINGYLREASGGDMTAKDFRTWHATVLAAVELAGAGPKRSERARRQSITAAMRLVGEQLGNTPTVARTSYVDPRVLDLYRDGVVVSPHGVPAGTGQTRGERDQHAAEQALLGLLREEAD